MTSKPPDSSSPLSTVNCQLETVNWKLATVVLAYTALLAYVSLKPIDPRTAAGISETRRAINNLLHVPAYAVLAVLWVLVLKTAARSAHRLLVMFIGAAVAVLFGGAIEVVQGLAVQGRMGTWADFGLNALGAALAGTAMAFWYRRTRERVTGNTVH